MYKMADYLYYQTMVESTITIMELIEEQNVEIHLKPPFGSFLGLN